MELKDLTENGTESKKQKLSSFLLRDICLKGAENEKFMYTRKLCNPDEVQLLGSQRRISFHKSGRISFHKSVTKEENTSQVFENLKSGSLARTLITSNDHDEILPLQNIRLMRVLNNSDMYLSDRAAIYSLCDTFKLVNSQLIGIKSIFDPSTFPSSFCLLWNLQILIIRGVREAIAPLESWVMTELRHFEFHTRLYLPDPDISQQMNGHEGDAIMKELHTLKVIQDFRLSDGVVKRIPNIKKLKISYELTRKELQEWGLKYLKIGCEDVVHWIAEDIHFSCLEHLQLDGLDKLVEIPSAIGDIPTLQQIDVSLCSNSTVISAKKILEEQENLGNVSLKVRVFCCMTAEIESLASDNFLVQGYRV